MNPAQQRASGVLLHITSLPGGRDGGDLGPSADAWIKFLASSKQRWWQTLPITAPGPDLSPYNSISAFAGDSRLVSPVLLSQDGLLPRKLAGGRTPQAALLRQAHERFVVSRATTLAHKFAVFCQRHKAWLDDYALFCALKSVHGLKPWSDWDAGLRTRRKPALQAARKQLAEEMAFHRFVQFMFFKQWDRLRVRCARRGIKLMGDVPAFVAHDSADVWCHPHLFRLDAAGRPTVVAGVPPDRFSRSGQRWGNPLYRWDVMRKNGYRWWLDRLRLQASLFDGIRLDHFIGYQKQWQISARQKSARSGHWIPGPGARFFAAVQKALGGLPFVAEDLGEVTEEVTMLRESLGLPGMRILQFAFSGKPDAEHHLPHSYEPNSVVYTGTHDNDTVLGWLRSRGKRSQPTSAEERRRVVDYVGGLNRREPHWDLVKLAWASPANLAIAPMQDLLGLDSSARMNVPGTTEDNWDWQLTKGQVSARVARRLLKMTETYYRV